VKPRIAPLEPPYAEDVGATLEAMMSPGVPPLLLFRTLARNPRILGKIRASNLLDRGSLERRDRELVILRATARCGCEYEWGVHVSFFSERVGLTEAEVRATARPPGDVGDAGDPHPWSPRDAALLRLVDELHDTARVSDALWDALRPHFGDEQLVELLVLAGYYHTISFVLNGLGVEREEWAARFPS